MTRFARRRFLRTLTVSAALLGLADGALADELQLVPAQPLKIRGVYPHLCVTNWGTDPSKPGYKGGGESGIGAVVPWAGKLWMLTYPQHSPKGSSDKLYAIRDDLSMEIRPESIGGTPPGRMIHRESKQLFIGPYAISADGKVRAIPYSDMQGRYTAISRHLTDPAGKVYYFDMEGRIYEVDVKTLAITLLFRKPVPGWHGKGGYTGQGRYIIANNGERGRTPLKDLKVGGLPQGPEDNGVLAEYDGKEWRIIERRQFTDITGPGGILGSPDDKAPVWAIGWDRRSVLLKLLDAGTWHTFRLPKASRTYDGYGGWYTEWPRIRETAPGKFLMDMHGMFWHFPQTFSAARRGGLRPMSSHHRYVPDFCWWHDQVVLASDETSIMGNPYAGQPQSNLWFGTWEQLHEFGPTDGWGGVWVNDPVQAGKPSDPFQIAGFPQRCLHLAVGQPKGAIKAAGRSTTGTSGVRRCSDNFQFNAVPKALAGLTGVTVSRGDYHKPAPGFAFTVNRDVVVYLAVDSRTKVPLGKGWEPTDIRLAWGKYADLVYKRSFPAGRVEIPANDKPHNAENHYPVPHMAFVADAAGEQAKLELTELSKTPGLRVSQTTPKPATRATAAKTPASEAPAAPEGKVTFTLEIDAKGDGTWTEHRKIALADGEYAYYLLPEDLQAEWIRITADKECTATAYFHLSGPYKHDADAPASRKLFAALADVDDKDVCAGIIRPAGHNRTLQMLLSADGGEANTGETYLEIGAGKTITFGKPATDRIKEMRKIASLKKEFEVDDASVIVTEGGKRYRLPKGPARYDRPFAAGWPRGQRECESERFLVNLHGTFYEKPREGGWYRAKPVATHDKQIIDYCTWKGLWVLSGTRRGAKPDGQYFASADGKTGLWFGQIDDIWRLGKPRGQGGPWKDTRVQAGQPSDAYLMTNYDRKRVSLSHDAKTPVTFTIEVDVARAGWWPYRSITVPPGKTVTHEFPAGYRAHWVRVTSDKACRATAWFVYE